MDRGELEKWARKKAACLYTARRQNHAQPGGFRKAPSNFSISSFVSGALAAFDELNKLSKQDSK